MERLEVMQIIEEKLRELNLYNQFDVFNREHNPLDGTHKKVIEWDDIQNKPSSFINFCDAYDSFAAAVTAMDTTEATLVITNQENVTGDVTVPATLQLQFLRGGSLNISNTKTVTINGHVDAGLYQIFEGDGTVVIGLANKVQATWFSGDDIGDKINKSFNSLTGGGTVELPGSIFFYSTDIYVPRNGETYCLSGQGYNSTVLAYEGTGKALNAYTTGADLMYINISDLRIAGSSDATHGIAISSTRFSSLRNVKVDGFTGEAVNGLTLYAHTAGAHHTFNCYNSYFIGNACGVYVKNYYVVNFFGGSVEQNETYNIAIDGASQIHWFGVTIEGLVADGSYSIYLVDSDNVDFYSCWLEEENDITYPIYLDSSHANFYNCFLYVYHTGDSAVVISLWEDYEAIIHVNGCHFLGNVAHPILKSSYDSLSSGWIIEDNCKYTYVTNSYGNPKKTWGAAAPVAGTWAVGDAIWNTAPAAGGTPGWVCVTAGTPGTWKAMANLAA